MAHFDSWKINDVYRYANGVQALITHFSQFFYDEGITYLRTTIT